MKKDGKRSTSSERWLVTPTMKRTNKDKLPSRRKRNSVLKELLEQTAVDELNDIFDDAAQAKELDNFTHDYGNSMLKSLSNQELEMSLRNQQAQYELDAQLDMNLTNKVSLNQINISFRSTN